MRTNRLFTSAALGCAALAVTGGLASSSAMAAAAADSGPAAVQDAEPVDLTKVGIRSGDAKAASAAVTYYAGYLAAGATTRYCFHFGHANQGAVAVSAAARTFNVVLATVSTDLENRAGYGWTYCATISNTYGPGTDVDLHAKAAL